MPQVMSDTDRLTPWLGRSGSRRRAAAFWMSIFFSLALIQVALPSLIHQRIVSRQTILATRETSKEETPLWKYPRPIADDALQRHLDRVQIKIVIPSRNHSTHALGACLSSIYQETGKKLCYKGSRFSTMIFNMDGNGNGQFDRLSKQYKPKECFEFYRNNSKLYSNLFKTASDKEQVQRRVEYANLLFMIGRFHPDFHIMMMNDDIVLCPNGTMARLQRAAAIADIAGDFDVILPTGAQKEGMPAAVMISKYATAALSEYIARTAERQSVIEAIMEFIQSKEVPSYTSKYVMTGTALQDPQFGCGNRVQLEDSCSIDNLMQLQAMQFNKLKCSVS